MADPVELVRVREVLAKLSVDEVLDVMEHTLQTRASEVAEHCDVPRDDVYDALDGLTALRESEDSDE